MQWWEWDDVVRTISKPYRCHDLKVAAITDWHSSAFGKLAMAAGLSTLDIIDEKTFPIAAALEDERKLLDRAQAEWRLIHRYVQWKAKVNDVGCERVVKTKLIEHNLEKINELDEKLKRLE